jgi:hypothetical protein
LRSVSTPQDGDVVLFGWYPGLGDDQRWVPANAAVSTEVVAILSAGATT